MWPLSWKVREAIAHAVEVSPEEVPVEITKDLSLGDISTPIAFKLAKPARRNPMEVAEEIADSVSGVLSGTFEVSPAKPGFVNFTVKREALVKLCNEALELGERFGKPSEVPPKKVQVEFGSVNPTGPLHVGHGRGIAFGDSLANVLRFVGYNVCKEYYVNDAGRQAELLGESLYQRYRQALGLSWEIPEDGYRGEYLVPIARRLAREYDRSLLELEEDERKRRFRKIAVSEMINLIRRELEEFGVVYDSWFYESELTGTGKVERTIGFLREKGLVYEKDGAVWFRSTEFGDEKDRVLVKSDGTYTYFAPDIAYHYNKFLERGFDEVIDVWGADHHGYVKRMKAAVEALGVNPERLKLPLVQIVRFLRGGAVERMSKREGEFYGLADLVREIGKDAARYFFVRRDINAPLDFDIELAKKTGKDNPVYYVQYAHARVSGIFRRGEVPEAPRVHELSEPEEVYLARVAIRFPEVVWDAATNLRVQVIPLFLEEVAEAFHLFYDRHRVLVEDSRVRETRVALCLLIKNIIKKGLELIGVSAPERM